MYTLGINAVYHDSSACLVKDGKLLAAAEEERFTRIKHAKRPVPFSTWELPYNAIDFCLATAGITLDEVDHVAYSFDPYPLLGSPVPQTLTLPLEPSARTEQSPWNALFLSYVVNAPRQLAGGAPHRLRRLRSVTPAYQWHFVDHHTAHAASAFFASPYDEAAVLTLDGRGERATATYSHGRGVRLDRLGDVNMPHSLGLLMEEVTRYLGFEHASDEYKVMALAANGKPRFRADFQRIVSVVEDGRGFTVERPALAARFGPPRLPGQPLEQRHFDIACSVQEILEETVLEMCRWLHRNTGQSRLCMAGGVALNCLMNGRLLRDGPFKDIWVQPAAGDAGTALGAALWVDTQVRGERRFVMDHAYCGPAFSDEDIEVILAEASLPYRQTTELAAEMAERLADGQVVGWFQGGMEFGPRALGARSILASPCAPDMRERLNRLKDREDFRPVAPLVIEEEAAHWFQGCHSSPFMLFAFPVVPDKAELIPSALHVDGTARVQTVNRARNPLLYNLLQAFRARTGVPVLINTSFNSRGDPIVCSPRDALACFWTSPLDALAIGPFALDKKGLAYGRDHVGGGADVPASATA